MKETLKLLNQRPIAYYPVYRDVTGSTTAGILLSQLMYWFSKKDKIHKLDADILTETLLTENELRSAKNKIKKTDFITVTREGIPAKTYYEIDWEKYQTCLVELTYTVSLNSLNCTSENNEPIIVKSLTETTTETTTENKEKDKKEINDFLILWNEVAKELNLSQINKLTASRKSKLNTRLKEDDDFLNDFKAAIEKIKLSNFLQGVNNRKWKVDFDWLIANDANMIKVLEGKFTDKNTLPAANTDFSQFGTVGDSDE